MEKIKTALCSFGISGWVFHAPFLDLHEGFELYGVLERTKNLAQEKYPAIKTFRSLEEMLADDLVELVIVNTPSITHFDFAKSVIEAGKHLVVEKPFTPTVTEANELIELAAAKNVKLSVYHNRRYDSDFLTIKKVLTSNLIGDLVDAEMHYDRYTPALSYKAHKEAPTAGVGNLYDLGSHLIDQALQFFGIPNAVWADITANRPGSQVADYFDLKLFYPAHRVTLKSSFFVREPLPGYVFHGIKGSFIKPKGDVQETALQAGKKPGASDWGQETETGMGILHTEINGQVIREKFPSLQGNYIHFYDAMYQAIRNDKPVPVSPTEAMLVIKIIELALQSNREKRVVDW